MGRYVMALLLSGPRAIACCPLAARSLNIVIYGANSAGISLANSVRQRPQYRLVAFVDDDPALQGPDHGRRSDLCA